MKVLTNIFGSLTTFFHAWGLFVYKLTDLHVESKCNFLQEIQDSFPCSYMHVQVSTSYLKCSNMYLFALNSSLLWGVVKFHF